MREIKFRAWYKQQMWVTFMINPYGEIEIHNKGEVDDLYMPKDNEYILMQCTGLKDKNGKEIYEGDIVKQGNWVGEIKWTRDFWGLGEGNYDDEGLYTRNQNLEIIGNIYENPELLK